LSVGSSAGTKRRKLDHSATKKEKEKETPKKRTTPNEDVDKDVLLAREVMLYGAAVRSASGPRRRPSLGFSLEDDEDGLADGIFKVPDLPVRSKKKVNANGKGKVKGRAVTEEVDVFGSVNGEADGRKVLSKNTDGKGKGRRKVVHNDDEDADDGAENGVGEVEKSNRVVGPITFPSLFYSIPFSTFLLTHLARI
jgi:hypothetical protein